jgi:hypothetical protein
MQPQARGNSMFPLCVAAILSVSRVSFHLDAEIYQPSVSSVL